MPLSADDLARDLGGKRSGNGWLACCPAHDDQKPSLSIWEDANNRAARFKCMAGCTTQEVKDAIAARGIGLARKGAGSKREPPVVVTPIPPTMSRPDLAKLFQWEAGDLFEYRTLSGELAFLVARRDGQQGKDIRPLTVAKVGTALAWQVKAHPRPRPLFRCERLGEQPDAPVIVVEGEKAVLAGERLWNVAHWTTWAGGASAVAQSDFGALRGREVTIIPDNDEPGRKAALQVATAAKAAGARSVTICPVPADFPAGWDVADPFPDGWDLKRLLALTPPGSGLRPHALSVSEILKLELPAREIIVSPFLARGALAMVYAERGLGKSWFVMQLAAAISEGVSFFGFSVTKAFNVLFIDGEMSLAELKERLGLLQINPAAKLRMVPSELLHRLDRPLNISTAEDQARIEALIDELDGDGARPDLIIFDNLSSLSAGLDENDNSALDKLLQWLVKLRHKGIACLLVHHAGKSGDQRGASRREDLLDTSLRLKRPDKENGPEHDGAHFIVEFTKTRGKKPNPFSFELKLIESEDGLLSWSINNAPAATKPDQVLKRLATEQVATQRALADSMGVSEGLISRYVKSLRARGWVEPKNLTVTALGREQVVKVWPELFADMAKQGLLPM